MATYEDLRELINVLNAKYRQNSAGDVQPLDAFSLDNARFVMLKRAIF